VWATERSISNALSPMLGRCYQQSFGLDFLLVFFFNIFLYFFLLRLGGKGEKPGKKCFLLLSFLFSSGCFPPFLLFLPVTISMFDYTLWTIWLTDCIVYNISGVEGLKYNCKFHISFF